MHVKSQIIEIELIFREWIDEIHKSTPNISQTFLLNKVRYIFVNK